MLVQQLIRKNGAGLALQSAKSLSAANPSMLTQVASRTTESKRSKPIPKEELVDQTAPQKLGPLFRKGGNEFWQSVRRFIEDGAECSSTPASVWKMLQEPQSIYRVVFPLDKGDDLDMECLEAFQVQHSRHRQPVLTSFRISSGVDQDEITALAALNTIKCALFNLPFGGGAAGIKAEVANRTRFHREHIVRRFTSELVKKGMHGPGVAIATPDFQTGPSEMVWIADTYTAFNMTDLNASGSAVGKISRQNGIQGGDNAPGLGVLFGMQEVLSDESVLQKTGLSPGLAGKTVVILGFGKVGYRTAKLMHQNGCQIIGIADQSGGICKPAGYAHSGLDPDECWKHKNATGKLAGMPGTASFHKPQMALELPCDILVPCALERVIRTDNAHSVCAKIIGEASHGPVSANAEVILEKKGVVIVPDVFLAGGAAIAAYFEWLKNLAHVRYGRLTKRHEEGSNKSLVEAMEDCIQRPLNEYDRALIVRGADELDIIRSSLEDAMITAYAAIKDAQAADPEMSMREASYKISMEKIHQSHEITGIFP